MRKMILFFAFAALAISAVSAQEVEKNVVAIYMSEDTLVTPDEINLQVVLQSNKGAGKKGLDIAQDRLFKILSDAGIDTKKSVSIIDFNSSYKGNNVLLFRTYKIVAKNMDQVDSILLLGEENGIANVQITSLEYTKYKKLQDEMRTIVLKNAKERAKLMAAALGQTIGNAVYISERASSPRREYAQYSSLAMKSSNDSMAAPMNVDIQKITVSVSVDVKFLLY